MCARVYVLLDVLEGKSKEVAEAVRDKPGVMIAETVEGPPDVLMVLEAPERMELAELMMQAFESVETMIDGVRVLPVRNEG
jgi:hypothetical protein